MGVEVESLGSPVDPAERGTAARVREDLEPRLEDRVAPPDPPPRADLGAVQGMGQGADEAGRGVPREPRVGVEGEDEGGAVEAAGVPLGEPYPRRAAEEELVQLGELPALPLPPHPAALGRIPAARAVEEEKGPPPGRCRPAVEPPDPRSHGLEKRPVVVGPLRRRVREVGQEREGEGRVGVRVVVALEVVEDPPDLLPRAEEDGDGDEGAERFGDPLADIEPGEGPRAGELAHQPVGEPDRRSERGGEREDEEREPDRRRRDRCVEDEKEPEGEGGDGPEVCSAPEEAPPGGEEGEPEGGSREARPAGRRERREALVDQVVADVAFPRVLRTGPREFERTGRDPVLRLAGATRDPLDHPPVPVARPEIHLRVDAGRVGPEDLVDDAQRLDHAAPVLCGEGAEREDVGSVLGVRIGRFGAFREFVEEHDPDEGGERPELREAEGPELLVALEEEDELADLDRPAPAPHELAGDRLHPGTALLPFGPGDAREVPEEPGGEGPVEGLERLGDDEVVLVKPLASGARLLGGAEDPREPPVEAPNAPAQAAGLELGKSREVEGRELTAVPSGCALESGWHLPWGPGRGSPGAGGGVCLGSAPGSRTWSGLPADVGEKRSRRTAAHLRPGNIGSWDAPSKGTRGAVRPGHRPASGKPRSPARPDQGGRIPRACRSGFSRRWVGMKRTRTNMTSATARPRARRSGLPIAT